MNAPRPRRTPARAVAVAVPLDSRQGWLAVAAAAVTALAAILASLLVR